MSIKKVDIETLNKWIDSLIGCQKVIGVIAKGDHFNFAPLTRAADLRLDYDVTTLPPKSFLHPPKEVTLTFKTGVGYESIIDTEPFVLFGIHPYDMAAIDQMDEIFSQGHYDAHYMTRRNNVTTVVVDVQSVSPNVFAGYMGTSHIEDGYDVLLTMIGDVYIVEGKTEKGESLMAELADEPDADERWLQQRQLVWEFNKQRLRKQELKAEASKWPQLLEGEDAYEHPQWEERSRLCFSCGSCNLVCPTCYCFDVRDEIGWDLSSGERFRVWDGCLLTNFATIAGNINFRKDRSDRYRHRYFKKALYLPSKIGGQIACVGCGRCITACVAKIANPVEIFKTLAESESHVRQR
ncbi:4Fe-4S dicluster domain-containing protein [Chloroflexota bacterium]